MKLVLSDTEKKVTLLLSIFLILAVGFGFTVYMANKGVKDGLAAVVIASPRVTLFTPLKESSMGFNTENRRILCVDTLPNPLEQSEKFCTDFQKVHVFVSEKAQQGTYADINYHIATPDEGEVSKYAGHQRFTDFITVYVQTEKERKQYQSELDQQAVRLYAPRAVALETPYNTHD